MLASMIGNYAGSVTFLGIAVDGSVNVHSATSLDITMSAPGAGMDGNCFNEAYHLDGSNVVLDNYGTAGNCLTNLFEDGGAKLKSAVYNSGSDEITIVVNKLLDIKIVLKKTSNV